VDQTNRCSRLKALNYGYAIEDDWLALIPDLESVVKIVELKEKAQTYSNRPSHILVDFLDLAIYL
jgi:hypothetical protein